jgi:hypothetical protein
VGHGHISSRGRDKRILGFMPPLSSPPDWF